MARLCPLKVMPQEGWGKLRAPRELQMLAERLGVRFETPPSTTRTANPAPQSQKRHSHRRLG